MIESQYLERIEELEREVAELQNNEKDRLSQIAKLTERVEALEQEDNYEALERSIAGEER